LARSLYFLHPEAAWGDLLSYLQQPPFSPEVQDLKGLQALLFGLKELLQIVWQQACAEFAWQVGSLVAVTVRPFTVPALPPQSLGGAVPVALMGVEG
jgi:hypothetical protein